MSAPVLRTDGALERPRLAPPLPRGRWITLSPINRRRLALFRQHRRGFWCLWIFLLIFGLSLFAEFIANDRPLVVSYKGEILFPVFVDYPEEKFGGFTRAYRLPRQGDRRRDRGARLDGLAADPLLLRHHQLRPAHARPLATDLGAHPGAVRGGGGRARQAGRAEPRLPRARIRLARHRRRRPRRAGAIDLRRRACPSSSASR